MLKHIKGDIFTSDADAILHSVNCQGVMDSGVARQVKIRFPTVFKYYKARCDEDKRFKEQSGCLRSCLLGLAQICYKEDYLVGDVKDAQVIINLFVQDNNWLDVGWCTDYEALRKCLRSVNEQFAGKKLAIPHLMACQGGDGDWSVVSRIIEKELTDCCVTVYDFREDDELLN